MTNKTEETFTRSDLLKQMIGDTSFFGETYHDEESLENLDVLNNLLDNLITIVYDVVKQTNGRQEISAKELNRKAFEILKQNKEDVDEIVETFAEENN